MEGNEGPSEEPSLGLQRGVSSVVPIQIGRETSGGEVVKAEPIVDEVVLIGVPMEAKEYRVVIGPSQNLGVGVVKAGWLGRRSTTSKVDVAPHEKPS